MDLVVVVGGDDLADIDLKKLVRFHQDKKAMATIALSLVDDPSAVSVNVVEGEKSTILELRVAAEDIGKVIGKHGRIAKAIRTVLQAATVKSGKRTVLEILD